jgi:hypothetical protein
MPPSADRATSVPKVPLRSALLLGAIVCAGVLLMLVVFYPGIMTYDAKFIYEDMTKGTRGDWQSPLMTVLWGLIDPLAPGAASMFLLMVALYWLGFSLLSLALARRSIWAAIVLLLLALSPAAFAFQGIIWRDVLFADAWLLAAALPFAAAPCARPARIAAQVIGLALLAFGVLLRPNALVAAPVLALAIVWPAQFTLKRLALWYLPAAVALFGLVQVVYYGALGATRQHPLHSIMVFDLGGISHFAGQNQFPSTWTAAETALITTGCYQPTQWDIYWRLEPCEFVMHKLEGEKLFGTPAITHAWLRAIAAHPVAYLQHRSAFMWNFLARPNLTLWTADIEAPSRRVFPGRAAFSALVAVHDALKPTPLFRAGTWLLVCLVVCRFAWRRRDNRAGVFALGVGGSGAVYVLSYFVVGVASDFRYAYWSVLAAIAGGVTLMAPRNEPA